MVLSWLVHLSDDRTTEMCTCALHYAVTVMVCMISVQESTDHFNPAQTPESDPPSAQVRTTRAGIVDYFTNFLRLSPQGKIDQSQIRLLSPTLALHSGVYSFTLEEEGKLRIVQVRTTTCVFTYEPHNHHPNPRMYAFASQSCAVHGLAGWIASSCCRCAELAAAVLQTRLFTHGCQVYSDMSRMSTC